MPGAQINIIKVKKSLPWKNEYNICKKKKHKNPFGWNLWSDYKVYFFDVFSALFVIYSVNLSGPRLINTQWKSIEIAPQC